MSVSSAAYNRLAALPHTTVIRDAALSGYTRFGIGGPTALLVDSADSDSFVLALDVANSSAVPHLVIGGGTNLVVADAGFDGLVLRYTGHQIIQSGERLQVAAGAVLQDVVDYSIEAGLAGLQTMTGIPGYLGGAIYGNAGAYGHSIQELVETVRFADGRQGMWFSNDECEFGYRESIFKRNKNWAILWTQLRLQPGNSVELKQTATEIRTIRDAKYPPTMKCAGSIFKNVFFANLPAAVQAEVPPKLVRDGKVPSAWFLEQTGAKGLRIGDIQVADYHANLIYNDGAGTAADLVAAISQLKRRVRERFSFELEEEVQYVGLNPGA
jgi:UDP-N-acetylmuramate dehydrogenase